MTSIIPNKDKKEKQRKTKRWPIVFWLMIWQAASVFVGQEILLASPAAVLKRLFTLEQNRSSGSPCCFPEHASEPDSFLVRRRELQELHLPVGFPLQKNS